MPYLICYDITDDRLRARAANALIEAGLSRLQYSVFCGDPDENDLKKLKTEIQNDFLTFASPSDSLLIFDLTDAQINGCEVIGHDALNREDLTGEQHTLII